jgi:phenylacetate-coenzyme A ligase PaaK-like adenylate-forming protein
MNDMAPYDLRQDAKLELLVGELNRLSRLHYDGCAEYRSLVDVLDGGYKLAEKLEEIPFLPVRLFKHHELLSVPKDKVVKTMTSSGTGEHGVSKIFLDKVTASLQIKVLAGIMASFIGKHRLPMLVIDSASTTANRQKFSARAAGILGFSMFGRDVTYALDESMELNLERISAFLERHDGEAVLLFGFTSIVWEHFLERIESKGLKLPLSRAILLHGGGWKKLASLAISKEEFKSRLSHSTGIERVHNYYGMVEQTGSIFVECEHSQLHSSNFSEIIIRDPIDFTVRGVGEQGLIQLLSLIPHSYPGHSLLSEDLGELTGIDDCPCGRQGRTFVVHGRIKNAEARGCSDTIPR